MTKIFHYEYTWQQMNSVINPLLRIDLLSVKKQKRLLCSDSTVMWSSSWRKFCFNTITPPTIRARRGYIEVWTLVWISYIYNMLLCTILSYSSRTMVRTGIKPSLKLICFWLFFWYFDLWLCVKITQKHKPCELNN